MTPLWFGLGVATGVALAPLAISVLWMVRHHL